MFQIWFYLSRESTIVCRLFPDLQFQTQEEIEQILLAYGLAKETINTTAVVH